MIDANATSVPLSGLALAIFAISIACLAVSVITVGLRVFVRVHNTAMGYDDWLLIAGLVFYAIEVSLACHGATVGLGSRTKDINFFMMMEGLKYLILWMLIYVIGLALIKSSICVTLLRIAHSNKVYRFSIFCLLGLTIATFLVTFVGILLLCSPVSGNWTGKGKCASMATMVALSYTSTAATITTDLVCVVIPGIMLWNVQMKPAKKASVFVLLSFASIASISTMIRAPYIEYYWTPLDNLQYYTGYIVLYSNIESATGLIATSLATLRPLFTSPALSKSRTAEQSGSRPKSNVTFGSGNKRGSKSATRDWMRLNDGRELVTAEAGDLENSQGPEEKHGGDAQGRVKAEYMFDVELSRLSSESESAVGRVGGGGREDQDKLQDRDQH